MDYDIWCISETHLRNNESIIIPGYSSFMFNRVLTHVNAITGSGGVCILVNHKITAEYDIAIVDKCIDGVLGLSFTDVVTNSQIVIFCCYLPPENSLWGREPNMFFYHLTTQLYTLADADVILLCGDFNSRIGNKCDNMDHDNVPHRETIDLTTNRNGDIFIDFLIASKMCVLNGRGDNTRDNFTFINTRGKSVVDFMCVRHNEIDKFVNFSVSTMSELISKYNLYGILGTKCKISDHSLLCVDIQSDYHFLCDTFHSINVNTNAVAHDNEHTCRWNTPKYNFDRKTPNFMCGEIWTKKINTLLLSLQTAFSLVDSPHDLVNTSYIDLCDVLQSELEKCSSNTKNNFDRRKKLAVRPYWCAELSNLYSITCAAESDFIKCNVKGAEKCIARNKFKQARKLFDKTLRKFERQYKHNELLNIDMYCKNDPKDFWRKIKRLGPCVKSKAPIPMLVKTESGTVSDVRGVLNEWRTCLSRLYNSDNISTEYIATQERVDFEYSVLSNGDTNAFLNSVI